MFEPDEDTLLGIRSGVNDFGDSHQVAMELQYRMAQPWQFFLAIAYDSPVGERDGGADQAAGHRSRLGAGIRYRWSKTLNLAFVYETADPEKTVSGLQRDETSKDSPDSLGLTHVATFSATLEF